MLVQRAVLSHNGRLNDETSQMDNMTTVTVSPIAEKGERMRPAMLYDWNA